MRLRRYRMKQRRWKDVKNSSRGLWEMLPTKPKIHKTNSMRLVEFLRERGVKV
jgi:hypothetical protein